MDGRARAPRPAHHDPSEQLADELAEHTPMVEVAPALPPRGAARIVKAPDRPERRPLSGEVRLPTRIRSANKKGVLAQVLVAGALILLAIGAGCPIGFSSVLLPQLQGANATISADEDTASWIASIHSAVTPIGTVLSGPVMDRLGRNRALQSGAPVLVLGWVVMSLASNTVMLLAARALCGIAVGIVAAPSQVLLGEMSEPRLRGVLVGVPFVSYSVGILYVFMLGSLLPWHLVSALSAVPVVLALIWLCLLPESPVWLVRQGQLKKAQETLDWLRGGAGSVQSKVEMDQLVSRAAAEKAETGKSSLFHTFMQPHVVKPMVIMNVYNALQCFSGTFIVIFYATDLLGSVLPPSLDARLAAILTAVVRIGMSVVGCAVLQYAGRRPVALASALGATATTALLGCVVHFDWTDEAGYTACALMLLYVAVNSFGMFMFPGLMMGEMLPTSVRGVASSATFSIFNIFVFAFAKAYPFLKQFLGSAGFFWLFSGASFLNLIWTYLFVPETSGRTLSDIEDYFRTGVWLWHRRPRRRPTSTIVDS